MLKMGQFEYCKSLKQSHIHSHAGSHLDVVKETGNFRIGFNIYILPKFS